MKKHILSFLILLTGISLNSVYEAWACGAEECISESKENTDLMNNDETFGVITVSVADTRTDADFSAEMATQLLLGMPVKVIKNDGWWLVKTPEDYDVWIEKNSFVRMNKDAFNQWINAKKVIFTDDYGFSYETPDENKQRVSDLVFGNLLKWEGESKKFFYVSYPDGRKAYISKKQALLYDKWKTSLKLSEKSIVQAALALKGIPYCWGGTSIKGMDCSGFSKTVFLKNGIILKRDAWQQALTGIPVDISAGYENLRPGDLLFFGKKATGDTKEKIRHVAIYIGNKEFIHSSGYIKINSLDPNKPNYDEGNTREFVRASRIIGAVGSEGIWMIDDNPLYKVQQ
jgi:cell wall-associated NlpC family hydrolase